MSPGPPNPPTWTAFSTHPERWPGGLDFQDSRPGHCWAALFACPAFAAFTRSCAVLNGESLPVLTTARKADARHPDPALRVKALKALRACSRRDWYPRGKSRCNHRQAFAETAERRCAYPARNILHHHGLTELALERIRNLPPKRIEMHHQAGTARSISMGLVGKSGSVASGLDATSAARFATGAEELAALGDDAGDAAAEAVAGEAAGLAVAAESVFPGAAVGVGAAGEQAVTSNAAQSRAGVSPARSARTNLENNGPSKLVNASSVRCYGVGRKRAIKSVRYREQSFFDCRRFRCF